MPALSFWCTVMDSVKTIAFVATFADFILAFFLLPKYFLPAAVPLACFLPILIVVAFAPSRVITGDDGVQWHHFLPFVGPKFLSYSEIDTILRNRRGCSIVRTNGQSISLYTSSFAPPGAPMLGTDALRRADSWRTRLRDESVPALPEVRNSPYRSNEEDSKALLALVAMPHAPPKLRIEAAKQLALAGDDDIREVLRALALASAEPTVRATLDRVSRAERNSN